MDVNTDPLSDDEKVRLDKLMGGRRYIVISAGPTDDRAYANTNSTTEFAERINPPDIPIPRRPIAMLRQPLQVPK